MVGQELVLEHSKSVLTCCPSLDGRSSLQTSELQRVSLAALNLEKLWLELIFIFTCVHENNIQNKVEHAHLLIHFAPVGA